MFGAPLCPPRFALKRMAAAQSDTLNNPHVSYSIRRELEYAKPQQKGLSTEAGPQKKGLVETTLSLLEPRLVSKGKEMLG